VAFVESRLKRLPQRNETWEADFQGLPQPMTQNEIEAALNSISSDDLRDVVNWIAVPRVFGTPENEAIWRVLAEPMRIVYEG
jgi:hypothetical protein